MTNGTEIENDDWKIDHINKTKIDLDVDIETNTYRKYIVSW